MVYDTAHLEASSIIPPQGGPRADSTTTLEMEGRWVGVYPAIVSNGGGGITLVGYLRIIISEHSITVYCDQYHYGPVYGVGEASGFMSVRAVVRNRCLVLGRDADVGLGGGTDRGVGGDIKGGDGDGLNRWEDTVANLILGTEHNDKLSYALGLELHHPIMIILEGHGGQLDRDI